MWSLHLQERRSQSLYMEQISQGGNADMQHTLCLSFIMTSIKQCDTWIFVYCKLLYYSYHFSQKCLFVFPGTYQLSNKNRCATYTFDIELARPILKTTKYIYILCIKIMSTTICCICLNNYSPNDIITNQELQSTCGTGISDS